MTENDVELASSPLSPCLEDVMNDGLDEENKSEAVQSDLLPCDPSANASELATEAKPIDFVDLPAQEQVSHQSPASTSGSRHQDQVHETSESPRLRNPRKRAAPTRLIDDSESQSVGLKKMTPTPKRKVQPIRGNWSITHLLSHPKSKLVDCNLSDLLNHEQAWNVLTRDEQLELISMLPNANISIPTLPAGMILPNILKQYIKSNSSFQADIRLFQEDLAAGHYDPKWLSDAQNAVNKGAKGEFDSWKENAREQFWGQKQRVDWMALAGESSIHNLQTLVAAGCFLVGDMWLLRRGLRNDGVTITVEKETTITHVSPDNLLTFTFPPEQHKISSPTQRADIVLSGINGPNPLSTAMLLEDGRIVGIRGANAWREFRCFRKNQDMGSLWDIRELYHRRNAASKEK